MILRDICTESEYVSVSEALFRIGGKLSTIQESAMQRGSIMYFDFLICQNDE